MRDHQGDVAEKRVLEEFFAAVHAEDRTPSFERTVAADVDRRTPRRRPALA